MDDRSVSLQYKFNRVFINNFSLFYRRKEITKAFAKCKHTCHRIERKLTDNTTSPRKDRKVNRNCREP